MSNETTLPPIRRIAVVHDTSTGKQEVQDDTLQGKTLPHGPTAYNGYVHEGITGDPKDGLKGTRVMPDAGLVQTNGVTFTYLDMPDGLDTPAHYAHVVLVQVIVFGSATLTYTDGTTKEVKQGDMVIHNACVHKWTNTSGAPCRVFGVCMPSKPVEVDGKGLDELFGAHKSF